MVRNQSARDAGQSTWRLDGLCCPHCHGPLEAVPSGDRLVCDRDGAFIIEAGIPSFCPADRSDFDNHWSSHQLPELPEPKRAAAIEFLGPVIERLDRGGPLKLLDAGCGDGVHVDVLSQQVGTWGDHVPVALDISRAALALAARRRSAGWRFVHGDVGSLPFRRETFDAAFSFGVLAYTKSPHRSFREICRVTKTGGLVGVWVYPRPGGLGGLALHGVRWLCRRMGAPFRRGVADMIVPALGLLPTHSGVSLRTASWRQCREVVLVNIAPRQLVFPTPEEVREWFRSCGMRIVQDRADRPVTIWGVKQDSHCES